MQLLNTQSILGTLHHTRLKQSSGDSLLKGRVTGNGFVLFAPFITGMNKLVASGIRHISLLNFSFELIEGTLLFEDFYLPIIALIARSNVRAYAKHFSQISRRELQLCIFAISIHASSHKIASI